MRRNQTYLMFVQLVTLKATSPQATLFVHCTFLHCNPTKVTETAQNARAKLGNLSSQVSVFKGWVGQWVNFETSTCCVPLLWLCAPAVVMCPCCGCGCVPLLWLWLCAPAVNALCPTLSTQKFSCSSDPFSRCILYHCRTANCNRSGQHSVCSTFLSPLFFGELPEATCSTFILKDRRTDVIYWA